MSGLTLSLLGPLEVASGSRSLTTFRSNKARALLIYLAVENERPLLREHLMTLLWPETPRESAQTNLRQVLYQLRKMIPELPSSDGGQPVPLLLAEGQTVQIHPQGVYTCDVHSFRELLAGSITGWPQALSLYRGDFLCDFYLPDSAPFEEWAASQRADLRRRALDALEILTESSLAAGDYDTAGDYARRQLDLDSFREAAHRQFMIALAQGDRRAEALAHSETLADLLWKEMGLKPAQKTQELINQIQAGEAIVVTTAGPQAVTGNIPEQLTPFVGREFELADIAASLARPDCRLLTLHGPGGAGKTALALAFARRRKEQYAQGVYFIPLAGLTSPANLVFTIAAALGIQIRPDHEPRRQLLRFLQTRQMLLLLDNFEHLKEGAGLLVDILQAAPGVQILVTSRDRLQLAAETIFEVSGLRTISDNGRGASRSVPTKESEAVQMFVTYARRACPDFQPDESECTAVADLCRLVEGMPLAIELAAAWVRALTPAEILDQIAAGSRILETTSADIPPRLRSVRASFNYSWKLLDEEEQQVLMRLSIFRGGCTRDSAEAVAGADPTILAALVDKSMLTYDPAACRYSLHELICQLAEEHLANSEREAAVACKHSHYFLSHAQQAWIQVEKDGNWEVYYRQIGPDLDNCRAALQGSLGAGDTESALQLAIAMAEYLGDHGMTEEAIHSLEQGINAGNEYANPAVYAAAYLRLCDIWWHLRGSRETLIELAQKGLALYQTIEDEKGVADALYSCGYAYHGYDWDRSRAYLRQSIEAYQDASLDPVGSLSLLANVELFTGNLEKARSLSARCQTYYEKRADEFGLSLVEMWMAFIDYYQGRLDKARISAEQCLEYRRAHSYELARILPLALLVPIALDHRRLDDAQDLLLERLRIMDKNNFLSNTIFCFNEVAEWLFLNGQPRQAAFWLGCHDQAREWVKQPVEPVALPHYQWLVSEVRDALGEDEYKIAWQKGYAVPVEDALPLALQVMEQTKVEEVN
jgi:predicted ATPase/DNA-binding SARP family transcriptional activator